jgi:hypothetical protein
MLPVPVLSDLRDQLDRSIGFTREVLGFLIGDARMMEEGVAQQHQARASRDARDEAIEQRRYHESPPSTI